MYVSATYNPQAEGLPIVGRLRTLHCNYPARMETVPYNYSLRMIYAVLTRPLEQHGSETLSVELGNNTG